MKCSIASGSISSQKPAFFSSNSAVKVHDSQAYSQAVKIRYIARCALDVIHSTTRLRNCEVLHNNSLQGLIHLSCLTVHGSVFLGPSICSLFARVRRCISGLGGGGGHTGPTLDRSSRFSKYGPSTTRVS